MRRGEHRYHCSGCLERSVPAKGKLKAEPIPYNLDGCPHYTDVALIPMQMMVSAYVDGYAPKDIKQRLTKLVPHDYVATSDFAPFDIEPRQYTYCLREGLSVGGVRYNETRMGGPKGDMTQFIPGVIQWDSGKHGGGVGWIAVSSSGDVTDSRCIPRESERIS